MKKFLIALICSLGISIGAQAHSAISVYKCPVTIYCPDEQQIDCQIPDGWGYHMATNTKIQKGTYIFSQAWVQPTNVGECFYYSNAGTGLITIFSQQAIYSADNLSPGNRWKMKAGLSPTCTAYLYPSLCPYIIQ